MLPRACSVPGRPAPLRNRDGAANQTFVQGNQLMKRKALTVAIAGALAAPMAAQAVDFTISGHVNRALVVVDNDDGTDAQVKDNGSSATRIRWTGSSEMMDGNSVGIQVEYQESGTTLSLRHANVHYSGEFGKATIGQGSEAGDGSAYSDPSGVFGIGHGQEKGSSMLGSYFGSLDGGTRAHMIRYDTPAIGPVSAAVSVGNNAGGNDRVSAAVRLSTEFSGSSFSAQLASLREDGTVGNAKETVGGSFGMAMASGLTFSGAWAQGDNHSGTDPSYFQSSIGYKFDDSAIAASWYSSEDFKTEGSEGTAIGVGVNHNLPKVGAQVYVAVQNYDVDHGDDRMDEDDTVFVVGTRVKF